MNSSDDKFAKRLKELRAEHNLTQKELANYLHVHVMTVSGYERGIRRPDFEYLDALAQFFNVSLDYLLGKTEKNSGYPAYIYYPHQDPVSEMKKAEHTDADQFFKPSVMIEKAIIDDDTRDQRMLAYYKKLVSAYDKADPKIKRAIDAMLDLTEDNNDGDS